jgi:hypothetical protein
VFAVCALLLGLGAAPAAADTSKGLDGFCPDANGITVVVDFGDLGGDPLIRCAPGAQATGVAALQNAGIEVTGSQKYGLAVACRLNGKPGPDTESCAGMPSATAYWSYWQAPNGGTWTAAQAGASTSKPVAGGFEGWSFAHTKSANDLPQAPRVAPIRHALTPLPAPSPSGGGSGFPWGVVAGVAVILLVGGLGAVVALRRKRAH